MSYLKLFLLAGLAMAAAPAFAQWQIARSGDPMTDAVKVHATLETARGAIQIGCDTANRSNRRYIAVVASEYIGGRPVRREVLLRFDSARPISQLWGHADRVALSLDEAFYLTPAIASSNRLVVRLTNYRGGHVDLVFDLRGSASAIEALDQECATLGL